MRMNRRMFLRSTAAGMSGWALGTAGVSTARADEATTVIRRTLGRTGLKLPVVSMGVMRADSPMLVKGALQKGITFFDTAHGYQQGKNEEMLGEVFAGVQRDSFVLATVAQGSPSRARAAAASWQGASPPACWPSPG